jgi:hypothetical protein
MEKDEKEKAFQFMLKEYEMLYGKFEMHYVAVEKTITLYLVIVGAIISSNSFLIKNLKMFSIFDLTNFQIFCSLFVFIVGSITIFKVIEHRLLIITYVKNLNQNRKWFSEKVGNNEFEKYSMFEASYKSPKYYKRFRHFYWEVLGLSVINSSFIAIFLINLFKLLRLECKYYNFVNWLWYITISVIVIVCFFQYYKTRANREEKKLEEKKLA